MAPTATPILPTQHKKYGQENEPNLDDVIKEWNRSRLEIFHVQKRSSKEYIGVIRFFYQDPNNGISMKCIRLESDATVSDLLPVLIEKFRPDLKSLSTNFCLCILDDQGKQRILEQNEQPLLIQLMYIDKEARFLLKTFDPHLDTMKKVKTFKIFLEDGHCEYVECESLTQTFASILVNHLSKDNQLMAIQLRYEDGTCCESTIDVNSSPILHIQPLTLFRLSILQSVRCYLVQTDANGRINNEQTTRLVALERGRTFIGTSDHLHCSITISESKATFFPESNCFVNCRLINKPTVVNGTDVLSLNNFCFRLFFVTQAPKCCSLDVLPGLLEVPLEYEDDLLLNLFKLNHYPLLHSCPLAPTLCLYMAMRHKLSQYNTNEEGIQAAVRMLGKSLGIVHQVINNNDTAIGILLANCAELLNLLRRDRDLSGLATTSERTLLSEFCNRSYKLLITSIGNQCDLALQENKLIVFLDEIATAMQKMLNNSMVKQVLNAILFHINGHLVNSILLSNGLPSPTGLANLLEGIEMWSRKFELDSTNYLAQIKQILDFSKCPTQIPDLLNRSQQAALQSDSRLKGVNIEQPVICESPLTLPDSGYLIGIDSPTTAVPQAIIGISDLLLNFIEPLCLSGMCRLLTNERSLGRWIEFLKTPMRRCLDAMHVRLYKRHGGLGLSIVAARGHCQPHQGIYIKSVLVNGSAAADGRLDPGDQILSVNGISLLDMSQEQAADALKSGCGSVVDLEVLKAAAKAHGLSQLMNLSSSIVSSGNRHTSFRYAIKPPTSAAEDNSITLDSLATDSLSEDSLATNNYKDEDDDRTSMDSTISIDRRINNQENEDVDNSDNTSTIDKSQQDDQTVNSDDASLVRELTDGLAELTRQWSLLDKNNGNLEVKTIGTQEIYNDPRHRKAESNEIMDNVTDAIRSSSVEVHQEYMTFKEKMKFFNAANNTS